MALRALEHPPEFATVADGVRAQVVRRHILPAHLDTSAHEGRAASCRCRPLLEQLRIEQRWPVTPRGTREACTQDQHELLAYLVATWPAPPADLTATALHGHVQLTLARCAWCGTVEVRNVSFHHLAGQSGSRLAHRRLSDVLGWYAGTRPLGRTYS